MSLLRPFVPRRLKEALTLQANLADRVRDLEGEIARLQGAIVALEARIAELPTQPPGHSIINHHERKVSSQNGEDGILEFIFHRVGVTNRTFVEFGVQDGRECNTANLALNHGWRGLLMESDHDFATAARAYYAEKLGPDADRVRVREALVTPENINELLTEEQITGTIDLLSIDIDGNDLWVWEAVQVVSPRVVVIEYNASFGPVRSISTAYDPAFDRHAKHPSGFYHGASLSALAKSGRRRGYLLAGCDSRGVNAFFVHEFAEAGSGLGELAPIAAYYPEDRRSVLTTEEQFETIGHLELVEI